MSAPAAINVGFLTVVQEANGFAGGYLLTNSWGRPLEFRLSTAVQPNKVHQILYAATLKPYICADLIGKALVEKTSLPSHVVLTDTEAALELRDRLDLPVGWVTGTGETVTAPVALAARPGRGPVVVHPRHPGDVEKLKEFLGGVEGLIDLLEPFARIREAMVEARKSGATRAA